MDIVGIMLLTVAAAILLLLLFFLFVFWRGRTNYHRGDIREKIKVGSSRHWSVSTIRKRRAPIFISLNKERCEFCFTNASEADNFPVEIFRVNAGNSGKARFLELIFTENDREVVLFLDEIPILAYDYIARTGYLDETLYATQPPGSKNNKKWALKWTVDAERRNNLAAKAQAHFKTNNPDLLPR